MLRKVLLYETKSGNCPVKEFIGSLNPKEQQKVVWCLKLLEDGFPLKEPYFKKIIGTEKIWEVRITFGGKAFRIFFFEWNGANVVLTSGFQKKTQKTPKKEIEIAKKYYKEFMEDNYDNA